ncbi:thiamine phosphate synthase, partial [Vibrio parahaemolyticus]|nr:thiamine phosphate synthase [Vibrio parahaemolyticus]
MAKILIPSSLIPLTGSVQQCLLLAKEQGFSIDEIELGVSPTQFIQLVLGQNTFRVGTDLIDVCEEVETADFVLYYQSGLSVSECRQQPSSAIFIGIEDVESKHDDSV